jgi:putative FmdB family regulatory protein
LGVSNEKIKSGGTKMPIYEYICSDCNLKFEELRPQSRAGEDAPCPRCHKPSSRKISLFRSKVEKDMSDYMAMAEGMAKSGDSSCAGCSSTNCGSCGV